MTRADEIAAQNSQHTTSKMHQRTQTVYGTICPMRDKILVRDMQWGETVTQAGIIILDDDGQERGIKPRWAQVWKMGREVDEDYNVGDWILIEHGRWTRSINIVDGDNKFKMNMVDPEAVMLMSDRPL